MPSSDCPARSWATVASRCCLHSLFYRRFLGNSAARLFPSGKWTRSKRPNCRVYAIFVFSGPGPRPIPPQHIRKSKSRQKEKRDDLSRFSGWIRRDVSVDRSRLADSLTPADKRSIYCKNPLFLSVSDSDSDSYCFEVKRFFRNCFVISLLVYLLGNTFPIAQLIYVYHRSSFNERRISSLQ